MKKKFIAYATQATDEKAPLEWPYKVEATTHREVADILLWDSADKLSVPDRGGEFWIHVAEDVPSNKHPNGMPIHCHGFRCVVK